MVSDLGLPVLICSQENASQTRPQANLMEAIPRARFPLPRRLWQVDAHTHSYLHADPSYKIFFVLLCLTLSADYSQKDRKQPLEGGGL